MAKPEFTVMGHCRECNQDVPLGENSWLPEHQNEEGERCKNSKYSPESTFYVLETLADAKRMAKKIRSDIHVCLRWSAKGRHSLACGDGKDCAEERARWANALAQFVDALPDE